MNHLNGFIDNEFLESGQSFGHFSVLKTPSLCLHHYDYLYGFLLCFFLTKIICNCSLQNLAQLSLLIRAYSAVKIHFWKALAHGYSQCQFDGNWSNFHF